MPPLHNMPPVQVLPAALAPFGARWTANHGSLSRTPPQSSGQLGRLFDGAVAQSLATMLGGIQVLAPTSAVSLIPPAPDCVELGATRVIGGVRPQNFDVCYRPDGVRFAFDSKTLNDLKSVGKNYQNMINDLATEATTVHTRFPYAIVAFVVAIPMPCLVQPQRDALIGTLDRLAQRIHVTDHSHLAEAIALVVWDPANGQIDPAVPRANSRLRLQQLSTHIQEAYFERYRGLPPHTV
jgi:hypothetical protein